MRALIVGAGIGGLTAAIALRRAGVDVVVLEQAPELREVGAGISLWPNAIHVLRRLGVGAAVEEAGARVCDTALRDRRGRTLHRSSSELLEARFGAPLVMIRRAVLHDLLRAALDPGVLRLGARCMSLDRGEDGVRVRLTDGDCVRGDVLVGADGLNSVVRAALVGDGPPRPSGVRAWRAVVALTPGAAARIDVGEWWGRGSLFGVQSLGDDSFYWYAASRVGGLAAGTDRQLLRQTFGDWVSPVPELFEATEPASVLRNELHDRPVPRSLASGRVALLGDAAHPMLPSLGQGACQAVEDAEVLAEVLVTERDPVAALRRYSEDRRPAAVRAVVLSRRMSAVSHLRNPVAVTLRNAVLRRTSAQSALSRVAPLVEAAGWRTGAAVTTRRTTAPGGDEANAPPTHGER